MRLFDSLTHHAIVYFCKWVLLQKFESEVRQARRFVAGFGMGFRDVKSAREKYVIDLPVRLLDCAGGIFPAAIEYRSLPCEV